MSGVDISLKKDETNSEIDRIPTAVADFDAIIGGGVPRGSVIILKSEVGAGHIEFALTSIAKLILAKEDKEFSDFYLKKSRGFIPEKFFFITISRTKDEILHEVKASFPVDYYNAISRGVIFKDFAASYFRATIIPQSWTGENTGIFRKDKGSDNILEELISFLDTNAQNSMIVLNALTDLVVAKKIELLDLVTLLKGLQRVSKKWGGVIYLLLTSSILEPQKELLLIDSVDGVITFEWSKSTKTSRRQRFMYVEKFMPLLMHLDNERITKFAIEINSQEGLVVSSYVRV
ncbi:MAG: RAD55 family ATPase [Thermoplasmata archaeon]